MMLASEIREVLKYVGFPVGAIPIRLRELGSFEKQFVPVLDSLTRFQGFIIRFGDSEYYTGPGNLPLLTGEGWSEAFMNGDYAPFIARKYHYSK